MAHGSTLITAVVLLASSAWGQGARLAVHPLELPELTPAQAEIVQAQYDVMLARITDIRLAGSSAVEDALSHPNAKNCETRDECLQFLAKATDSLYGVYARVRPDPLGAQLVVNARVVRSDGAVVRKVTLASELKEGADRVEVARQLLARLVIGLELHRLSPTLGLEPVASSSNASPLFPVQTLPTSPRQPVGFALLGIGGVAVVAGCVVAGVAANGRSKLTVDANGAVPPNQAVRAHDVAREAQSATVLLPVGAVVAVVGAALAWWP